MNTRMYHTQLQRKYMPRTTRQATQRGALAVGICALLALACSITIFFMGNVFLALDASAQTAQVAAEQAAQQAQLEEDYPTSTPTNQWTRGVVPHLYQSDPAWADQPYAGGTMSANACGPTSLCMAYVALTGNTDWTPLTLAQFAETQGFTEEGATQWLFMTEGAKRIGIQGEELNGNVTTFRAALEQGQPVILVMGRGDFTESGHFIVATAIDENDNVTVNDPKSPTRSARPWPAETLLQQARNLWAMSV